jgi:hypothetical protein
MTEQITENQNKKSSDLIVATLQLLKQSNPRIGEILTELKTVQSKIDELHVLKKEHRYTYHTWIERTSFFYLGKQPCDRCEIWNTEQELLRDKKSALCKELEQLSYGMDPLELLKVEEEEV